MIVYYPGADESTISKVFALADAHGNNVGDIDHLFAEDVVVKVILDVTKGMAFVQNADTNAYLEAKFATKATVPQQASGEVVSVSNSDDAPLLGLKLYGKTVQNGTPTPENPVPLESVGESGAIKTTVAGKNLFDISLFEGRSYCTVTGGRLTMSGTPPTVFTQTAVSIPVVGLSGKKISVSGTLSGEEPHISLRFISAEPKTIYEELYNAGTISRKITIPDGTVKITLITCLNKGTTGKSMTAIYDNIMLTLSEDATYEIGKPVQNLTASTPNGLPGIPVTSGGNYTDSDGQQWICDEVDFAKGVYVQRVGVVDYSGSNVPWATAGGTKDATKHRWVLAKDAKFVPYSTTICDAFCTVAAPGTADQTYLCQDFISCTGSLIILYLEEIASIGETSVNAWLRERQVKVLYILAEENHIPLSEIDPDALAQYAALHSNYPNTTMFNDRNAGMEVKYVADTRLYIDQKFAQLAAALVNRT
jgi:hypothetical protein